MKLTFLKNVHDYENYTAQLDKTNGVKLAHFNRPPSFPCFVHSRTDRVNAQHDYIDNDLYGWMVGVMYGQLWEDT